MKRSKITKLMLPVIIILIMGCKVQSQNMTLVPDKNEIIAKAWKAMFGELKPEEIKSIYVEGYFHGSKVPNKSTVKRPNLFRNEIASGILVFDGHKAAWVKREKDAEGNLRSPEMIEPESWKHFEVDIALIFPAFFDYPSEFRGIKKYNDKEAYEIYVDLPLGSNISYFIDVDNFLVNRRLVSWDGGSNEDLWKNQIDTYLQYNGILFPEGYTYPGREGMEKGYYKNVRFNIDPKAELFVIPDEIKK